MKKLELGNDAVLNQIVDELKTEHHCHVVILYGSRGRCDHTSTSDYDVLGVVKEGQQKRIARFDQKNNVYLDIFVYPESFFSPLKEEHLHLADGVVILDGDEFGKKLLETLKIMIDEPEQMALDEIQARKVWYRKMLSRASVGDLEGRYRHIWSIFAILEDYFVFRGMRYQGPKKAFQYLEREDPEILLLFHEVLFNPMDLDALGRLIEKVVD